MAGRKTFTAGEVLQAADVNDFLMDQSVMVFAGTAARGSAIPSPTDGMASYRTDDDAFEIYDGSAWSAVAGGKILQVAQTVKTDTFSMTSATYTDVTGLTVTITPSSTSSKLLVFGNVSISAQDTASVAFFWRINGGGASSFVGDSAGSRVQTIQGLARLNADYAFGMQPFNGLFLDSPATTSAVTYAIQVRHGSAGTVYVNQSGTDTDSASFGRGASSITVMEVAG